METHEVIQWVTLVGVIIVVVGTFVLAALMPHFEASAFNECTGGNAGYWTAFFTELRVENCTRP